MNGRLLASALRSGRLGVKRPTHPNQVPAIMTAKRNMIVIVSALMAFLVPLICTAQQTGIMTLETLQAAFRSKQAAIEAAFVKASSDALNTYGRAIEPARRERKNAGDLDAVLALDEELKRFAADRTIPAPDKIPAAIAREVATYRKSIANAETARTTQLAGLLNIYIKSLDSLVKRLTQQDKLDDAKAASAEKDRAEIMLAENGTNVPKTFKTPSNTADTQPPQTTQDTAPLRIEGFAEISTAPNSGFYRTFRNTGTMSHWTYAKGEKQHLEWQTAKLPISITASKVIFVWAGANSHIPGSGTDFDLRLNGKQLLVFNSAQATSKEWTVDEISLAFSFSRQTGHGNFGTYSLTVPTKLLKAGQQQQLRVVPKSDRHEKAWIMVHNFTDMTAPKPNNPQTPVE